MKSKNKIGVFDSGVGGLTVARAIRVLMPHEDIVYFGDSMHLPYGNKSESGISVYSENNARFLVNQGVKIIVSACNTSTAIALPLLKKKMDVPVVGVIEPGAQAAVQRSRSLRIGVIGTYRTIASNAYKTAILKEEKKAKVKQKACPLLVPIIEEGFKNKNILESVLKTYLENMANSVDSIVLGCTHYPLIQAVVKKLYPRLQWIDSATATAREVKKILMSKKILKSKGEGSIKIYTNDLNEVFLKIAKRLFPREPALLIKEKYN